MRRTKKPPQSIPVAEVTELGLRILNVQVTQRQIALIKMQK